VSIRWVSNKGFPQNARLLHELQDSVLYMSSHTAIVGDNLYKRVYGGVVLGLDFRAKHAVMITVYVYLIGVYFD
jgi:hypothetical protein